MMLVGCGFLCKWGGGNYGFCNMHYLKELEY
jgi:hypothetical protein